MVLHTAVVALVLSGPIPTASERQTMYEQVIAPRRHELIWYSFRKKLPPVSPTDKQDQRFRGAEFRYAGQTIVSNPRQGEFGEQRIHHPSPQIKQPPVASPSILAFRMPLITAPAPTRLVPSSGHPEAGPALPPELRPIPGHLPSGILPLMTESTAATIKTLERTFVPPTPSRGDLKSNGIPPMMEAPSLDLAGLPSFNVDVAIVGLNPAARLNGSLPDGSLDAKFSAGPVVNGATDSDSVPSPSLSVPSLLVRDSSPPQAPLANPMAITRAAPTSRENLEAATRAAARQYSGEQSSEIHLVPPPDPTFDGREVYSFAVQMPNISSHSGSWLMWFAEREPLGPRRELQPPVLLHKVDPKYIPSAIAERVEGKVVLAGVLQTDGRVREIRILNRVDARLELSAARALRKWEFVPAQRNGVPIEMDLVAVIPFLLGAEGQTLTSGNKPRL